MLNKAVILGRGAKWVGTETVIRWEEYPLNKDEVSLPQIVDDDAQKLRDEYLSWINELGAIKFGKKSLPQRLEVFPGISIWWSSEFAEKSFWKTPEIYDVLRLRALELYCNQSGVQDLTLCDPDRRLHEILKDWCAETNLHYEWQPKGNEKVGTSLRKVYRKLTEICPVLFYLLEYVIRNIAFLFCAKPAKNSSLTPDGLTIFSYSANFDKEAIESGRYGSSYWDGLSSVLNEQPRNVNWLFRFYKSQCCPDGHTALKLANMFNQNETPKQRFFFLEQWLSWSLIFKAVFVHYKVRLKAPRTKSVQHFFRFPGSKLNIWPVMRKAWIRSIHGYDALDNVMTLMLLRELITQIPRQEMGICLSEFMGWERSLIQCWHANGFGRIMGYIHCFVSFFDFRFFADKGAYSSALPRYDNVIVNSQVAWDLLQDNGYPIQEARKAESLKQSYLCDWALKNTKRSESEKGNSKRLLVLTDYDKDVSLVQLKLLGGVLNSAEIRKRFSVTIKPHPLLNVDDMASGLFPAGFYKILDLSSSLAEALLETDIVYASNFTSAAIDAAFIGLPIIISSCGAQVNMSPLRGVEGVTFVSDVSQLNEALNNPQPIELPRDFFYLNKDLRLWKDLLEHNGN